MINLFSPKIDEIYQAPNNLNVRLDDLKSKIKPEFNSYLIPKGGKSLPIRFIMDFKPYREVTINVDLQKSPDIG